MKIYIVRHGETAANVKSILVGQWDEPLNQNGRDLAVLTGRAMRGIRFDECISSPLSRAYETAEIILRESGNEIPILRDDRAMEISFGDLEGLTKAEMGQIGELFYKDPFHCGRFPNGESIQDVCCRTQAIIRELAARDDGKTYLVSTHGCAMRAMVNFLFDHPSDYWRSHVPYNCSFTIIEAEGGVPRLTEVDKVYYDKSLIVDHFSELNRH